MIVSIAARSLRVVFFGIIVFSTLPLAQAIEVLDQQWTDIPRANSSTGFDAAWGLAGQTFTVGVSGILSRVEIYVSGQGDYLMDHGDLQVSIWSTISGLPDTSLATVTLPESNFPMKQELWANADFSAAGLQVSQGQQFGVVLASTGAKNYSFYGTLDAPFYGGGTAVEYYGGVWGHSLLDSHYSHLFKEYVLVPEPGSCALFALGLLCVVRPRRRR